MRRACRLRADSTLKATEVWKEAGRDVDVDSNDDDANANVAVVDHETAANRSSVQVIQDRIVIIHACLVQRRPEAFLPAA